MRLFAGIFALVLPPIIIPLYLGVMSGRTPAEKSAAALTGAVGFFPTMTVFTFFGAALLGVFGISRAAFRLTGGFLLLLIALDMMRSDPHADSEGGEGRRGATALALGIVPITIPILAGPGVISEVVLFATDHDSAAHRLLVMLVLLAVALWVFLMLRAAAVLDRYFTPNTALVFNKVMGLIIAAIAFEFVMHGIAEHFVQLDIQPH
ncbi:MAG: MarC family protein [Paracoccaceae bacterium]